MRAIRVDITGTSDASGNFSQVIRLDRTGEFRNVKVAIGTLGPAEWSLSTAGTPLTYGRGRRVTLGPELLQPFDVLTVSFSSGPANAAVQGSCTGQAGTEQEMVELHVPAPNTIALDVQVPNQNGDIGVGSIAIGTATLIAAGTGGMHTYLYEFVLAVTANASCVVNLDCPFGTTRCHVDGGQSRVNTFRFDGLDCGPNAAVVMGIAGAPLAAGGGHCTARVA